MEGMALQSVLWIAAGALLSFSWRAAASQGGPLVQRSLGDYGNAAVTGPLRAPAWRRWRPVLLCSSMPASREP